MGFRFRKSINLGGGARINLSKSGIGGSIGVKGFRVTRTANGRTRKTISIPGTGLSYVSESKKRRNNRTYDSWRLELWIKIAAVVFPIAGIMMIALGALLTLALPMVGLFFIIIGVIEIIAGKRFKKRAKENEINKAVKSNEEDKI